MFASAATGLRALQRCARGVRWSAYHQDGQYQALRFLSACPISCSSSKDDSASDGVENSSSGAQGGGDSGRGANSPGQIVDPAKDASLQDLFVIPIKKPLIPGGIPLFEKIVDPPLIQQLKEMEQLGSVVRVALFARKLPKRTSSEDESVPSVPEDEQPKPFDGLQAEQLEQVGTLGMIKGFTFGVSESGEEVAQVGVQALRRVKSISTLQKRPLKLQCRGIPDEAYNSEDTDIRATHQELTQSLKQVFEQAPVYLEQMRHVRTGDFQDFARFADLAVSLVNGTAHDLQDFLMESSVPQRMLKALAIVKKELELLQLQKDISRRVEEKFTKEQKRYFLMEQMKHIQKELGITKDEKAQVVQKFLDRFNPVKHNAPEEVQQAVEEEIQKLKVLETASSEYNVTRNYLDWLTSMPYGVFNEEKFDIPFAQECLDADHYGMQDVKDRILEFIAVGKLNDAVQGKIVCMVGPPGVGKTSIGKSIANSLGREFFRFSVGGLSDVAEIKGHRRTYVGAMPGKLVQCLKQSSNPLVLIDEIDKLGRGMQGDPASALLELLDPEQNHAFRDHYLDVPLDLSKVLFICTANVLDTISRPLLDRMEVIELSGYTWHEKLHIARKYLEKQVRTDCAIPEGSVDFTDDAMSTIIQQYCRESGVRNLKKQLEKVYRKAAKKLATSDNIEWIEEEIVEDTKEGTGVDPAKFAASLKSDDDAMSNTGSLNATSKTDSDSLDSISDKPSTPGAEGSEEPDKATEKEKPKTRKKAIYTGDPIVIDTPSLDSYLGKPPFDSDRFYQVTPPGVVMGLAWTSMGGSTLYVESQKVSSTGVAAVTITGQLGDVMKESISIAQTFVRRLVHKLDPESKVLEEGIVHLHVPQGATPKDGPSAGCTAVTALFSLAFNEPVAPNVAMTGEISLSGYLLPIGGVKEKALAAKRSGVQTILLPQANQRDWQELSEEVREGLQPQFSKHYLQMVPYVFPSIAERFSSELEQMTIDLHLNED